MTLKVSTATETVYDAASVACLPE